MTEIDTVQWGDLPLASHHVKALVESGITPAIARARGYRSIDPEHLDELGELSPNSYGRTMRYAGLLIPSHGVTGGIVGHQLRPDAEVVNNKGDVRKYMSPFGEASVIDCPPTMLDALRDQTVPIMITEGSKKADSAAARGLLCLALRGVDCWTSGSNTALEAWRDFPMLGRKVAICYDSDITEKSGVRGAAKRLGKYLTRQRGAIVSFIILPGRESGAKVGLDDWLVDNPDGDPWSLAVDRLPENDEANDTARQQILATDLDVADEWVARNSHGFRYLAEGQNWLGYRDGIWDGDGGETYARVTVQQMVRTLQPYTIKYKDGEERRIDATPWLRQSGRIPATLAQAAANEEMVISAKLMNPNPYLFNLGNGTWDLRRGLLLAHDPDHLITLGSSIHHDPDAVAPLFEEFLEFVLPEPETRAFVQRIFGMAMIGDSRDKEHVFPVFHGKGRNGKGTLLRLIQEVFGSYYTGISKGLLILRQYEEHSTVLAALFRKRLVTAQEVGEDDIWNVEQIKMLTGADDITGRYMREDNFTFIPSHTLIMAANNWPKVSAKEEAFWARVRKIPFVNTFAHGGDPNKEKALRTELPGILNWLIRGAQDYMTNGLGEPAQVAAATASTRASADPIQNFLDEYVVVTHDSDDQIVFAELFERYEHWHRSTRERTKQTGRNNFGKEIARSAGIAPPREAGKNKISTFFGIRFSNGLGATDSDGRVDPFGGPDIDVDNPASDPASGVSDPATHPAPTGGSPDQDQAGSLAGSLGGVTFKIPNTQGPGKAGLAGSAGSLLDHVTTPTKKDRFTETLNDNSTGKRSDSQGQQVSPESHPADPADPAALTAPDRDTWAADHAEQPSLFEPPAVSYDRLAPADYEGQATEALPEGVLAFDIEGAAVQRVFTGGPEFIKIFGYQQGDQLRVTEDVNEMLTLLRSAKTIVGHNIMSFDLMYFAINHGLDIHQLAAEGKLLDTQLAEVLLNPPPYWMKPARVPANYKLDKLGEDKFGVGKSADLGTIVKRHGGDPKVDFDKIPNDDREYVTYCAADVDLTARIARTQRRTPTQAEYMKREHRIAAIAAQTTMTGVKVDLDLLNERAKAVEVRKAELREKLMDQYGMPRTRKDGSAAKGMTAAGRAAVEQAFGDLGVTLPRSASGQGPATDKVTMDELMEQYADRPEVTDLIETVKGFNGQRTVYGSALANLHPDGRVHPTVNMYQATGRWSVQNPGMTVFGKRAGKYVEREIFIADEGEVLIAADLSQVDARAIGAFSQDEEYLLQFGPGMDLHAEVAFQMFGDRGRREEAKALSHGYNYGLGFTKLAAAHGEELADLFLKTMRSKFQRLVEWKLEIKQQAIDNNYVLDNGWGRTLIIDPGSVHTQAPAYVGQSAARDIMMEGLLRLPRWVLPMLRIQVHDEIVLSVPEDRVDEIKGVVADALSFPWRPFNGARGHERSVQIIGEAGKHAKSWGAVYAK